MASRESLEAERSRASLAGMSQLSGLAEMSLEREEGKEGRQEGVWKEYVKADGRKWYYNTETRVMQWTVPEPFCKLDEVAAIAKAANEAHEQVGAEGVAFRSIP